MGQVIQELAFKQAWFFALSFHQKTQAEFESLDQEHTKLQQKHDAAKARNRVLASELKGLKAQVQTLLEKGAHDDELIAALMVSKGLHRLER